MPANKKENSINIYWYYNTFFAFGDILSALSHSILFSSEICFHKDISQTTSSLIRKLLPNLKTKKDLILTNKEPTHRMFCVQDHPEAYIPTQIQWKNKENIRKSKKIKSITYQIESPGNPRWNFKRFFSQDEKLSFKKLQINLFNKINFIPLGKHKSIEDNIKSLSECEFFLGIDSGLSHLSHCCGTPCFLKNFNMSSGFGRGNLDYYHPNKKYTKFNTFQELIPKILELAESK
jgi:hypothetical protein